MIYATGLAMTDGMKALFMPGSAVPEKPYTVDRLLTSLFGPFQDWSAAARTRSVDCAGEVCGIIRHAA